MSTKGIVVINNVQKKSKGTLYSYAKNTPQAPSLLINQYTNSLKNIVELPKLPGSENIYKRDSKEKFEPLF